MIIAVSLNGTDKNPYEKHGLNQNPFPQIAKYEVQGHLLNMQKLGGPPIPKENAEKYIRSILDGWSEEFINLCLRQYRDGEYVKFDVNIPDEHLT